MAEHIPGGRPAAGDAASNPNQDLISELAHIAEATGVIKRTRGGAWVPDLAQLGKEIGRSHNAFSATLKGGEPEIRTIKLVADYARQKLPGYNPVRLYAAARLLGDDEVARYVIERGLLPPGPGGEPLTPARRALMDWYAHWPEETLLEHLRWLENGPWGAGGGTTRAGPPTP